MLDSTTIFDPGFRVTDANGDPVSGAKIKVYLSGTSTPTTVYSDSALTVSLGSTVTCDSAGYPTTDGSTKTLVWMGTSAIKVVLTDSADAVIATHDGITGAIATSQLGGSGSGAWETSVTTLSTDTTLDSTYYGKLIQANPTGGSFTLTLPSAVTATNKKRIGFRHSGTANQVKIATVLGQTISRRGASTTVGFALTEPGQTSWLVSDGANWTEDLGVTAFGTGRIVVAGRRSAAPTSPTPGAIYIATSAWSTVPASATNDALEADGQGGWIQHTPTADCGWIAYVQDEDLNYQYQSSSWVALSNITAPAQVYQGKMVLEYSQANGTDGGATITGARTTYPTGTTNASATMTYINSSDANAISGATLTTNKIKLPVGWYHLQGGAVFDSTDSVHLIFRNSTTSTDVFAGPVFVWNSGSNLRGITPLEGTFQVTSATDEYIIQYWAASGSAVTAAMGRASAFSDGAEVYGRFVITSLAMQQGPQGSTGTQGNTGRDAGVGRWTFSTTTTVGAASGTFRFNNATIASATALYINETDADSNSLAATIQSWDDSTSTIKGYITFRKQSTPSTWAQFAVTGSITDNGSDDTVTIAYVTGNGSFSASDSVLVSFSRTGDAGAAGSNGSAGSTGASGPGPVDYTWDTGTSAADPGTGKLRANNASLASATAIYINETDRLGNNLATYIQTWDDSTTTTKGVLQIVDTATPANRVYFSVTGSVVDNGTYDTLTVSYLSGVTSFSAGNVALLFYRTGDKGADGAGSGDVVGPAASVDSEIALFSSTTGKLLKRAALTGLVKATAGVASAATAGTDYLAPPSGTALLKANSGGALANATAGTDYLAPPSGTAILKANSGGALANAAAGTDYVAPGGALGTPSSGFLTNCTGLPASSLVASTTQAVGFGSIELGHASDTTIARVAAGTVTIEGNTILTNNQTATIAKGFTLQPNNLGTVTSGTVTLDPTAHNYQYLINGGAFTLAPPAAGFQATMDVRVINGPSAGSITLSTGKWRPMTGTASFSTTSRASATITVTIASPGVVSWTSHGCIDGDPIYFTTTGALPTGISASTVYYVKYVDANSFQLSATPGGTAINTSGSQSGTHTGVACSVFDLIVREPFGTPAYAWVALQ